MQVIGLGAGRCGTKSLARLLGEAGSMASHEPKPSLERLGIRFAMGTSSLDECAAELLELREPLYKEHPVYCESAHWYSWLLPVVKEVWPDVKIIWLTRPLLPWAMSAYRRGWYDRRTEEFFGQYNPDTGVIGEQQTLRLAPKRGWPPCSRWFKLSWMYHTLELVTMRDLQATGLCWTRFECNDLGNTAQVKALMRWAGMKFWAEAEPVHNHRGEAYNTAEEIKRAGIAIDGDLKSEYTLFERSAYTDPPLPEIELYYGDLSAEERFEALADGAQYAYHTIGEPLEPACCMM